VLDRIPDPGERSERARSWWTAWIVVAFLVALVGIPVSGAIRDAMRKKPDEPPAVSPEVVALLKECDRGQADSCRRAARAFRIGKGAPLDESMELRLIERADLLTRSR
jgi:hypothetical protein